MGGFGDFMDVVLQNSTNFNKTNEPLQPWQVLVVFFGFVLVIFLLSLIKKIWYRYVLKKRYYIIPRAQIKGIANIAMVISMTVAIIFSLTILSVNGFGVLFRAYVGSRMLIESILIKLGGLLFGPFIGIFIGAFTDLLTVILTSGVFNYGYFISAIGYGLIAGLIKTLMVYSKKNHISFAILNTGMLLLLAIITFIIFLFLQDDFTINSVIQFNFLSKNFILYALIGLYVLVGFIIWIALPLAEYKLLRPVLPKLIEVPNYGKIDINKSGHNSVNRDWYSILISSIIISLFSQVVIDIFMLPVFDITISTIPYGQWFAFRFLIALPLIIFNSALMFGVYWVIAPIIKYHYEEDMVEDINKPFQFL